MLFQINLSRCAVGRAEMKKAFVRRLLSAIFATVLTAGCIVGDGDALYLYPEDPPGNACTSHPDDPMGCGKPWNGHIVQTCGLGDSVLTRLYFDRPDVPDSARMNVMELGALRIDTLKRDKTFRDTLIVCDQGACRELTGWLSVPGYVFFLPKKTGRLSLWDPTGTSADWGDVRFDDVRKESCGDTHLPTSRDIRRSPAAPKSSSDRTART